MRSSDVAGLRTGLLAAAWTGVVSVLLASFVGLLGGWGSAAAAEDPADPTATVTSTVTETVTATATVTETVTATATATVTETVTASPTDEPSDEPSEEPSDTGSPSPTGSSTPVPTGAFTVSDAALRWGLNDESNNRAFAPGTFNFLSAGKIPDPGRGGVTLPEGSWKQHEGNVSIEKYVTGSGYLPATWAGLKTDADGVTIPSATSGRFSNHQVVVTGGAGTVDPVAGTATIRWTGDFTVLYYSGYSFFYVSDPVLTVAGGVATLTATLSGFASSMDDMSQWSAVAPREVTLADLGPVDLSGSLGFTATPAYRGVAVNIPATGTQQLREGADWGSFPQSFVDYQLVAGAGSYWYSSGGSNDAFKPALPVTVSYAAGAPVAAPTPTTTATRATVKNKVKKPPTTAPATTTAAVTAPVVAPPAVVPPVAAPLVEQLAASQQAWAAAGPMPTVLPVAAGVPTPQAPGWPWWVGAAALLAAAGLTLTTALTGRQKS